MNWNRSKTLLVTGASGHLGRRVVEILLDAEAGPVVAATRTPETLDALADRGAEIRRADFNDPASLDEAFDGVDRLLLVSTDALGHRLAQHRAAIRAAVRAGVRHIVYTSLPNPEKWDSPFMLEHVETEKALKASRLGWTVLRNNLYADYLVPKLSNAIPSGQLAAAAGDGGAPYVTREDCAGAAAAALASSDFDGRTIDVTGPGVVTHTELAKIASDISRGRVTYVRTSPEELRKGFVAAGMSRDESDVLVTIDVAISKGWLGAVTDAVEELTGHPPASVAELLAEHSDVLFSAGEPALVGAGVMNFRGPSSRPAMRVRPHGEMTGQ
jgi:NAD(P)H dehydrogenase (quinone)